MSGRIDRPVSREELVFVVEMALQKKRSLWPARRRPGEHDRFRPLAAAIVDHVELCGFRCIGRTAGEGSKTPDPLD
ncbi:MAG: hypothetical protein F4103_14470 [Boseongicola sp. SB0673_bin_14]|nr:hypothetical protein [Chloroflexota bacterium]MYI69885.1 hypothetical protein [Boseongicola sp. SB0673_bin_14]